MTPLRWRVAPTALAASDIRDILRRTRTTFGTSQLRRYEALIASALVELEQGPSNPRLQRRDDLGADIWSLRIARPGKAARHIVVCRCHEDRGIVQILRILHDSMDPTLHLPPEA